MLASVIYLVMQIMHPGVACIATRYIFAMRPCQLPTAAGSHTRGGFTFVRGRDRTTIPNKTVRGALTLSLCARASMKELNLVFLVLLASWGSGHAQRCRRRFPAGQADCGTLTEICSLDDVFGPDLNSVPFPPDKLVRSITVIPVRAGARNLTAFSAIIF